MVHDKSGMSGEAAEQASDTPPTSRRRRILPIHPLLFAAFPLLLLYSRNIGEIQFGDIRRPLGIAMLGTLAVWMIFLLLTRHLRKAALASSAVVVTFFSYGHILNILPPSLRVLVAPGCAAGLIVLLWIILRTRRALLDATTVLNLASAVLIAPSSWAIGSTLWDAPRSGDHLAEHVEKASHPVWHHAAPALRPARLTSAASSDMPDVYYIILDAYGRADRLKQFYGYDNTPFLRELEKRGFYIARHSAANYDQTHLSLACALNMNYLGDLGAELEPEILRRMMDDSTVAACLKEFGYRYIVICPELDLPKASKADLALNDESKMTTVEGQVLGLTALDAAPQIQRSQYDQHRDRIRSVFRNLEAVARLPSPKFVLAHAMAPHPPFVFGANGEAIDPKGPFNLADASWLLRDITKEEYRSRYIAQLQYVNRRVLETVDAILRKSRRPPILLLQGDHGSRMNLDWASQARTDLREPFSILNAYYVPKQVRRCLYDTITPVNSFRILLTRVFGADYPPLPDRSFYSTAYHPYDFSEVTRFVTGASSAAYTGPAAAAEGDKSPREDRGLHGSIQ
jgi:hypothetical protein